MYTLWNRSQRKGRLSSANAAAPCYCHSRRSVVYHHETPNGKRPLFKAVLTRDSFVLSIVFSCRSLARLASLLRQSRFCYRCCCMCGIFTCFIIFCGAGPQSTSLFNCVSKGIRFIQLELYFLVEMVSVAERSSPDDAYVKK